MGQILQVQMSVSNTNLKYNDQSNLYETIYNNAIYLVETVGWALVETVG
jgi:hypothetical protein